jgi:D-3-phosphoglycerate dehydrogenase
MALSNRPKILVTSTNYSIYCSEAKQLLESSGCEIIENMRGRPLTFEELSEVVHDVSGVVAGVDTWNEEVFKLAPKLKVIGRFGVGVDNIDLDKAREYGVQVTNVPGGNANAVAEFAVGLILSALRNIPNLYQSARRAYWDRHVGEELQGKRVGLLGFGNISRKLARKLQGFDVELVAFDKYPNEAAAKELNVKLASFEEVLSTSDIVSMHLPALPETYHIMGDKQFGMMKPGSYFINTARGTVVNEEALRKALTDGPLGGAAIDVYEHEPVTADNPLLTTDRIVTTPHTAAETLETYRLVGLTTARAILDVLEGRTPHNLL